MKENEKIVTGQERKINHGDFLKKKIEKNEKDNISSEGKVKESDIKNPRDVNNSFSKKFGERKEKSERKFPYYRPKTERLDTKRVSAGSKGGRRFSFTSLVLILMEEGENHGIAFANAAGKESIVSFRKAIRKAQKKLINYFPDSPRTIPHDILVKYKATKIFLKPAAPGSGIKAGGVLNKLFKFLKIKDISAKIIGSRRSKLNVIRAAFLALDKLTGKKYDY